MSYEGYDQVICANGHYFTRDAYNPSLCSCGAEDGWTNGVDDTNCDESGKIPVESLAQYLVSPQKTEVCNLGHSHITAQAVYRIPTKDETRPFRVYPEDANER